MEAGFFAHTTQDGRPWEPLSEHLRLVATRARDSASVFDAGDEAFLAGLLHDLGKYGEAFQRRLRGEERGLDHWTLGAWAALKVAARRGWAAALSIEGHHLGLQAGLPTSDNLARLDPASYQLHHPLHLRPSETDVVLALDRLRREGLGPLPLERSVWAEDLPKPRAMAAVRMLFSALVDADFVETEAFVRGDDQGRRYRRTGPRLDAARALEAVRAHLDELSAGSTAAGHVASLRTQLLEDCLEAARRPRGSFTLTAPTGAGKTLAMLAFALAHAARHGLRRIVLAIPFLSIIEQTAAVYRRLFDAAGFPSTYVLEHHSLTDGDGRRDGDGAGPDETRLLAENWDAPIVVTTNVQLLESLFANRPRRCRKLHNVAQSVLLFDEAQTLPPDLSRATLSVLGALVRDAGCSVVFATATQPAFEHLDGAVRRFAVSDSIPEKTRIGWQPEEIVRRAPSMFRLAKRTIVHWETSEFTSWSALADRVLEQGQQVLVIVNLKRHARALTEALNERSAPGLAHLSTNLCPLHRAEVLAGVRRRLAREKPCVLVSTQCVEAGVDLDFPAVFRSLAPLDSIAQAAGRCNRNGLRELGDVFVFRPEDEAYPRGIYAEATEVTRSILAEDSRLSIDDPESFRRYYRSLYDLTGEATAEGTPLEEAVRDADFPAVAKLYRLIRQDTVQVVVPWEEGLIESLRRGPFDASWVRRARAATVAIYRPRPGAYPALEAAPPAPRGETPDDWFLLGDPAAYDRCLFGLDLGERDLWIA